MPRANLRKKTSRLELSRFPAGKYLTGNRKNTEIKFCRRKCRPELPWKRALNWVGNIMSDYREKSSVWQRLALPRPARGFWKNSDSPPIKSLRRQKNFFIALSRKKK